MLVWKDDYDKRDIFTLLESLHTVQQHGLSCDPPELLELRSASARPLAAGDNYNADVALH